MAFFSVVLASVGSLLANVGSKACMLVIADEPECPKSLTK